MMPIFMDGYDEATDIFTFDANHPLAGETLTFQVEVVDVQDATEELAQELSCMSDNPTGMCARSSVIEGFAVGT